VEAQRVAEEELAETAAEVEAEEEKVAAAAASVEYAKSIIHSCEQELRRCDEQVGLAAMERFQLEAVMASPATASPALVERLLQGSGQMHLQEEPEQRFAAAIAARDNCIRGGASARVSLIASLEEARAALTEVDAKAKAQQSALDDACTVRYDRAAKLKGAWDAVRQLPDEQARADAALQASSAQLVQFQTGPLATVNWAAGPVPPPASAPARAAATSAAGIVATAGLPGAPASPRLTGQTARRQSFQDIRRRRVSWLPRKMAQLRIAGTASAALPHAVVTPALSASTMEAVKMELVPAAANGCDAPVTPTGGSLEADDVEVLGSS
jgi:hypothetical protein